MSDTLKHLVKTDGLNSLIRSMTPAGNPNAPGVEYDFGKCPQEFRGEIIVSMARIDGFVISLTGSDIAMHTMGNDHDLGNKWFEVVGKYHVDVLWFLSMDDTHKTVH